jgi:hypothetical protein
LNFFKKIATSTFFNDKGSATANDRIVILSDINPFEKFSRKKDIELLNFKFIEKSTKKFIGQ